MASKPNTLIDSSKLKAIDDWLGPKQGTKPVADVDEYMNSEKTAKELDPPGSVKSVAKARRRVFEHAVGMTRSGLTADALFEEIARLAPPDKNRNPTSAATVRRVFQGILELRSTLTGDDE